MRSTQRFLASAALAALAACGGAKPKSGLTPGGSKDVPPPPPVATADKDDAKAAPKREISKDERKDFDGAVAFFEQNEKGTWTESACRSSVDRFQSVVRSHPQMVEAQYMVGLSYERCNLSADAERAYQAALKIKPGHGQSLSNLGELYYRAGKVDGAKQYWESAIKANGKLVAARINIASMELEQMRKLVSHSPEWKKIEEDARFQLSSALGVDSDSYHAYTVYGLVYMEGWQKNRNRLDLAKLLLDEGKKRQEKYAPLQNAYGLFYMHRNALSEALKNFQAAVELDPKFIEARMNVGLTTLGFRNYDMAKEQFTAVLALQSSNYDAVIGLGSALRGLKDFDGAEREFKKAMKIDGKRGEAFYNLGVLYKDFRATKQGPQESLATYNTAKQYFQDFQNKQADPKDIAEAKEQVALIEKTVKQTQKFLQSQANQPAPAPGGGGQPATAPAPKQ
ncbi:MAG TPA: tetratricopeptide repeat protein [Kofleriaceae bacterium]|nr:tetratricopeptide repeat protein [Kofleriaceae bacterium]